MSIRCLSIWIDRVVCILCMPFWLAEVIIVCLPESFVCLRLCLFILASCQFAVVHTVVSILRYRYMDEYKWCWLPKLNSSSSSHIIKRQSRAAYINTQKDIKSHFGLFLITHTYTLLGRNKFTIRVRRSRVCCIPYKFHNKTQEWDETKRKANQMDLFTKHNTFS